MLCTKSPRKTTLTLLDTRKLRLHSTLFGQRRQHYQQQQQTARIITTSAFLASEHLSRQHRRRHTRLATAYLDLSFESNLIGGEILRQTTKKVYLFLHFNYLPHEARHDSGESVTVWVFYLNYWAIFDTAKGVFLWLDERTCLILSFLQNLL